MVAVPTDYMQEMFAVGIAAAVAGKLDMEKREMVESAAFDWDSAFPAVEEVGDPTVAFHPQEDVGSSTEYLQQL